MTRRDLSPTEQRIWEAFPQGTVVDLRSGDPSGVDAPAQAARWGADRTVRGEVIAALLLGARRARHGHVPAVRLTGARIIGVIDVSEGSAAASLRLSGCHLDSAPGFTGTTSRSITLNSCVLPGFSGRLLQADGDLIFESCDISERLELRHAHVRGSLHLDGSHLASPGQQALAAGGITVDGGVFGRSQLRVNGNLRLVGGVFNGGIFLEDAQLHNPDGDTLTGDRMTVHGPVECTGGFQSTGTLSLRGAAIGSLCLDGATLHRLGGFALHADHLNVATYLRGTAGFTADGETCINDAHIGTALDFTGALLRNPGGSSLTALGIRVDAMMNCCEGFRSSGQIELYHGRVGQHLCFERARLYNPGGIALWAEHLHARELLLQAAETDGTIDLRNAQIEALHDDPATWPAALRVDGLTYESLDPHLPAHDRLQWLHHDTDGYIPRADEQLSGVYQRLGHTEDARTILLAKQRHRRQSLPPLPKTWGYLQDWIVGYGYRPARAGLGLLLLWALGTIAFTLHHPTPAASVDPHTFQPVIYTLGLMLPVIDFQEEALFTPHGAQLWLAFTLICAGWILATTVATAITRALRGKRE